MSDAYVPVLLDGIRLWVQPDVLEEGGHGALAPEGHIEDGDLRWECCMSESYAHVFPDGEILRYGKVIGQRSDLDAAR